MQKKVSLNKGNFSREPVVGNHPDTRFGVVEAALSQGVLVVIGSSRCQFQGVVASALLYKFNEAKERDAEARPILELLVWNPVNRGRSRIARRLWLHDGGEHGPVSGDDPKLNNLIVRHRQARRLEIYEKQKRRPRVRHYQRTRAEDIEMHPAAVRAISQRSS